MNGCTACTGLTILFIVSLLACRGEDRSQDEPESPSAAEASLKDGFYPIVREGSPNEDLVVSDRERLMVFRPKGSNVPTDIPPRFLVIPEEPAIRLTLAAHPEIVPSRRGVPDIRVELVEGESAKMWAFSQANLGRRIAIVVRGDVVSTPEVERTFSSSTLLIQCPSEEMCRTTFDHLLGTR